MDAYIEITEHRWPCTGGVTVALVDPFARFAEGQRTVTEHREQEGVHRWQGTIDNEGYKGRVWRGRDVESVIDQMEKSLGAIDAPGQPTKYVIAE